MKRLLLLRHAKSSWDDASLDDWERPLNDRGRRDAPRAGEWLRDHLRQPDAIITSDAVRARTTAEAVAKAAGYSRALVIEPSLYLATPQAVLDLLNAVPDEAQAVLVVGHNPGLEELVRQLTGGYHAMPTAALIELELPIEHWSELDEMIAASVVESWHPSGRP